MPEQANQAPARVSAGKAEASMTCPVCKGEKYLEARQLYLDLSDKAMKAGAFTKVECPKCGGAGQVPAEGDPDGQSLAAWRDDIARILDHIDETFDRLDAWTVLTNDLRSRLATMPQPAEPGGDPQSVNAELLNRIKFLEELVSGQAFDIAQRETELRLARPELKRLRDAIQRAEAQR